MNYTLNPNNYNPINNSYIDQESDDDFIPMRRSRQLYDGNFYENQLAINSIGVQNKVLKSNEGQISIIKLFRYLIELECFYCCNNQLYYYDKDLGYLKRISEDDEALYIRKTMNFDMNCKVSSKQIDELIKRIKTQPELNIDYEELNANSMLINAINGVVNIETGELLPHDFKYKFTYYIKAKYIKDEIKNIQVQDTNFIKFCRSTFEGNSDKLHLLLEIIGYLLSDMNEAKKAIFFVGLPHSGKSLLCKIITKLVGDENISSIPIHKLGDRFSNSELSQKKVNIGAEMDTTPMRKIGNFKAIVGGDNLMGEFKGKKIFTFKSKVKLLFAGNALPESKDIESTTAFVDRICLLLFQRSTPKEEMDYDLENKLVQEMDIIFTSSIIFLKRLWMRNFKFTVPEDSKLFLEAYANNQNHISEFINECCELNIEGKIHTKIIYKIYLKFCEDNCIAPYKENMFTQYILNIKDVDRARFRANGKNLRGFKGITIKEFMLGGTEHL